MCEYFYVRLTEHDVQLISKALSQFSDSATDIAEREEREKFLNGFLLNYLDAVNSSQGVDL